MTKTINVRKLKKPTLEVDTALEINTNNLNTIMLCPHCESNEVIHGTKKWKCMECHKSFKKPKTTKNASTIPNIKTFDGVIENEVTPITPPELVDSLNRLLNSGGPSINMLHVDEEGNNPLITNSKEIENFITTEKNEIVSQIQRENEPIPPKNSEIIRQTLNKRNSKISEKKNIIRKEVSKYE